MSAPWLRSYPDAPIAPSAEDVQAHRIAGARFEARVAGCRVVREFRAGAAQARSLRLLEEGRCVAGDVLDGRWTA